MLNLSKVDYPLYLQVELLGKYLAKENITRVYSSDYLRAYRTAEAIVQSSKNSKTLRLNTDVRLRERVRIKKVIVCFVTWLTGWVIA